MATNGTTVLNAGNDVNIRQGTVDAGAGLLSIHADRNVKVGAGQSTQALDEAHKKRNNGFLSSTTTATRDTLDQTLSQGSSLSGGVVSVTANNDIAIEGSAIRGADGVLLHAGNVLTISEARDSRSESNSVSVKKSGFGLSGGSIPMVVPKKEASRDSGAQGSNTAVASSISSQNGGVLLQGDGAVLLQGAKVDAAKDITIQGGQVSITAATNYDSSSAEHYERNLNLGTETWWRDPGTGINAKRTDKSDQQASSLDRTTLNGANVSIIATGADGNGGLLTMAGTTVNTHGTLTLPDSNNANAMPTSNAGAAMTTTRSRAARMASPSQEGATSAPSACHRTRRKTTSLTRTAASCNAQVVGSTLPTTLRRPSTTRRTSSWLPSW